MESISQNVNTVFQSFGTAVSTVHLYFSYATEISAAKPRCPCDSEKNIL
jgi:hypothetical protein